MLLLLRGRSTVNRYLKNDQKTDCYYLDNEGNKVSQEFFDVHIQRTSSFTIDGEFYPNINAVVKAFNINKATVYGRTRSRNPIFAGWIKNSPSGEPGDGSDGDDSTG
jgi:hypothetical protein